MVIKTMDQEEDARNVRPWQDLPDVLLQRICNQLSLVESIQFGAVCKAWNTVSQCYQHVHNHHPWLQIPTIPLMKHLSSTNHEQVRDVFWPKNCFTNRCIGASQGCLIMRTSSVDEAQHLYLWNPFSKSPIIDLPPDRPFIQIILSSPPRPGRGGCVVFGYRFRTPRILFCNLGDKNWTCLDKEPKKLLTAVAFKGKFYALDYRADLYEIDVDRRTFKVLEVSGSMKSVHDKLDIRNATTLYLVESCGEILTVITRTGNPKKVSDFVIFRLDLPNLEWVKMDDLGGRVLYLGDYSAISSPSVCCCRNEDRCYKTTDNRIFFSSMWSMAKAAWQVFNMKDGTVELGSGSKIIAMDSRIQRNWILPNFE
ncbi:hypothetical protein QJS04_geneDACA009380 [Acorus gramineus]|uniref:F-box domain-containing protein n=1 Tax=Acorus gramineus TaxID=55184 RepID=A0AAV9AFS0_ACOGR|nr:hypothetical protein QJS04_geneDACA009380 [Acorus gramineus]